MPLLMVAVSKVEAASLKVTVPDGTPPGGCTEAVKVTVWSDWEWFWDDCRTVLVFALAIPSG
jgi:hypothetical protein